MSAATWRGACAPTRRLSPTALGTCRQAGPFLTGVVTAALRAGRAARAQTGIGVGALSVASAGLRLLAAHLPLASSRVLVIGDGRIRDTIELGRRPSHDAAPLIARLAQLGL